MRATTITLSLPVSVRLPGRRSARAVRHDAVQALAFAHVAYHRNAGNDGGWTVTHRDSALAVARDLPTRDAARDLALTLEREVTMWPVFDQDGPNGPRGGWSAVNDLAQVLRLWRIRTVDGHDLARTLRRRNSVASA